MGAPGVVSDAGLVDAGDGGADDCPSLVLPPGLGGPVDSEVTLEAAQRWVDYRAAREQERMLEARDAEQVAATYRVEQSWIDDGCLTRSETVDLGRSLFLRNFTLSEGFGNALAEVEGSPAGARPPPNMRRVQEGHFGGPDANACFNCHWKGGFASGGDRADNAFVMGDGDDIHTADTRNPPALWGAGWTEIIGREMSADLAELRREAEQAAVQRGEPASVELVTKGVHFGTLTAIPEGEGVRFDTSDVVGVDHDLRIKPFGWKGTFATLREFVAGSLHFHLNMQSEELVDGALAVSEVDLGNGAQPGDPDNDGVRREITEGQLTALVAFLATLDTPGVHVPTSGSFIPQEFYTSEREIVDSQEFTVRWLEGANLFVELGCASCHTPLMPVRDSVYRTHATLSGTTWEVDLAASAAKPLPEQDEGVWMVPVFSDFKRHRMGDRLAGGHVERGVPADEYLTRRLWGVANTRPYMHDGRATLFDEAIAAHGGNGSEALGAANAFAALPAGRKSSVRVFLLSLRRAPAIRVR